MYLQLARTVYLQCVGYLFLFFPFFSKFSDHVQVTLNNLHRGRFVFSIVDAATITAVLVLRTFAARIPYSLLPVLFYTKYKLTRV